MTLPAGKSQPRIPADAAAHGGSSLNIHSGSAVVTVQAEAVKEVLALAEAKDRASRYKHERLSEGETANVLKLAGGQEHAELKSAGGVWTFSLSLTGSDGKENVLPSLAVPITVYLPLAAGLRSDLTVFNYKK